MRGAVVHAPPLPDYLPDYLSDGQSTEWLPKRLFWRYTPKQKEYAWDTLMYPKCSSFWVWPLGSGWRCTTGDITTTIHPIYGTGE